MSTKITNAAIHWVILCDKSRELAERRGLLECEREEEFYKELCIQPGKPIPCWKNRVEPDGELLPQDEWCPRCVERQAVHDELRRVARSRGAAQRTLVKYVRQFIVTQEDSP